MLTLLKHLILQISILKGVKKCTEEVQKRKKEQLQSRKTRN